MGQSTAIGMGGDPVVGLYFRELLAMLQNDPQTDAIVMIDEIGGNAEELAAAYIREHVTKPGSIYCRGICPAAKQMGHAGATQYPESSGFCCRKNFSIGDCRNQGRRRTFGNTGPVKGSFLNKSF